MRLFSPGGGVGGARGWRGGDEAARRPDAEAAPTDYRRAQGRRQGRAIWIFFFFHFEGVLGALNAYK